MHTLSVYQIHSQTLGWPKSVVEDTCSCYHTVGQNPEPSGWKASYLPHSHPCSYVSTFSKQNTHTHRNSEPHIHLHRYATCRHSQLNATKFCVDFEDREVLLSTIHQVYSRDLCTLMPNMNLYLPMCSAYGITYEFITLQFHIHDIWLSFVLLFFHHASLAEGISRCFT